MQKNNFLKKLLTIAPLVLTLGLGGCAGTDGTNAAVTETAATEATATEAAAAASTASADGIKFAVMGEYNGFLQAAIEGYKGVAPGTTVELVEYPWGVDQYSQSINTAIMSGSGEDIFDVSLIMWQKLADKDKLADLDEYIQLTNEDYFQSTLDSYLYKGRHYAFPLTINQPNVFMFTEKYRGLEPVADLTLETLLALGDKYPDAKLLYIGDNIFEPVMVADIFFLLDYGYYIDAENKTANINNERFISLLNNMMKLKDRIAYNPDEDIILRRYTAINPVDSRWVTEYSAEGDSIWVNFTSDPTNYADMMLLTNGDGRGLYESTNGVMPAINANSGKKSEAAGFISFLLSPEMQTSPEIRESPVNKKAYPVIVEDFKARVEEVRQSGIDVNAVLPIGFDLELNTRLFNDMVDRSLGIPNDSNILTFSRNEMRRFLDGEQTAEQTAANLQSLLTTYLNE